MSRVVPVPCGPVLHIYMGAYKTRSQKRVKVSSRSPLGAPSDDTQVAVKIIREGGLSPAHIAKVQRVSLKFPTYSSTLGLTTRINRTRCESQSYGTASDMKMSSRCTASPPTLPSLLSYREWFRRGATTEMYSNLCRGTQTL